MGALFSNFTDCCDQVATTGMFEGMKRGLEGKRIKAKTNPQTEPEVYVTIVKISKKDDSLIKISPVVFTLRDVSFETDVEIIGSKGELAKKAAMKGADLALKKMDDDKKGKVLEGIAKAADKALSAKDAVKGALGKDNGPESMHIKVDLTVDMQKEMGNEDVSVKIKDFHTDMKLLEKIMGSEKLRKHMEDAMSQKASEVATKLSGQKMKQAEEAIGEVRGHLDKVLPK